MNDINNPYAPPAAVVADIMPGADTDFQPVKIFSAKGRIGRLRYFVWLGSASLILGITAGTFLLIAALLIGFGGGSTSGIVALMGILVLIILPIQLLTLILFGIQRSHDMNWSGWAVLMLFLAPLTQTIASSWLRIAPITGIIMLINFAVSMIWLFVPGSKGANRFGPPPPPNSTAVKVLAGIYISLSVILIISVIAAITLPAYQSYANRTRATQSQQE
jgi:uncharacterized membrane protein YhaH (DUF805 family)